MTPGLILICVRRRRIAGDGVAFETCPDNSLRLTLVDHEYRAVIAGLAAFDGRDLHVVVALFVIHRFEAAAGFFNGVRIERVFFLQFRFLQQRAAGDILIADELDVLQRGPLDHLEDDHDAVGALLVLHPHVEEFARAGQQADVFLDDVRIERLADAGGQLWQLFHARGVVAFDAHFPHDEIARRSAALAIAAVELGAGADDPEFDGGGTTAGVRRRWNDCVRRGGAELAGGENAGPVGCAAALACGAE